MIKILCDRCNAEIGEHENIGYIAVGTRITKVSAGEDEVTLSGTEFSENHYCQKCVEKIKAFIRSAEQTEEQKEDVALVEPQKKQRERRKIDIGKIIALKNAGWSAKKIGEEMDMTDMEVNQAIRRYRLKMEKQAKGD